MLLSNCENLSHVRQIKFPFSISFKTGMSPHAPKMSYSSFICSTLKAFGTIKIASISASFNFSIISLVFPLPVGAINKDFSP